MTRPRLLAALIVSLALLGGVLVVRNAGDPPVRLEVANAPTTSSTVPATDYSVQVESEALGVLSEEEEELTEDAQVRSTSTTEATTTTVPAPGPTSPPTTSASGSGPAPTSPPTTSAPPETSTGGYNSGAESDFASRINSFRGSNGLASLKLDGSLNSYARSWAKKMAANGSLSHSNIGSLLPPWTSAGENVGVGGSVAAIFDALTGSAGHRGNMLEDFTHMGVGVWQTSEGVLWTAHVFTR